MIKVTTNSVVTIDYILKNEDGNLIESTFETKEPLTFIQGKREIVFGLEEAILSKELDSTFTVNVEPDDAYGEYNQKLIAKVPKSSFDASSGIEVGMDFQAEFNGQVGIYKVIEVTDDTVIVDGNHPFAGVTLCFTVTILSIREATETELLNGLQQN